MVIEREMVERLVQHKHCRECGRAIPAKDVFCSGDCESGHKRTLKRKKNQLLLLYVSSVVILILILFLSWGWPI
jgi:predicted nucleic acid-binding Zn ribbon protein